MLARLVSAGAVEEDEQRWQRAVGGALRRWKEDVLERQRRILRHGGGAARAACGGAGVARRGSQRKAS